MKWGISGTFRVFIAFAKSFAADFLVGFFFSFLFLFLDGLTKVICVFFLYLCFRHM